MQESFKVAFIDNFKAVPREMTRKPEKEISVIFTLHHSIEQKNTIACLARFPPIFLQ